MNGQNIGKWLCQAIEKLLLDREGVLQGEAEDNRSTALDWKSTTGDTR